MELSSGYPADSPADLSIRAGHEVADGFPREWFTFMHPDDPEHEISVDLTWLMSGYSCRFGTACQGIDETPGAAAAVGCCVHGAFLCDEDDYNALTDCVSRMPARFWQFSPENDGTSARHSSPHSATDGEHVEHIPASDPDPAWREHYDFASWENPDAELEPYLVWDELENDEGEMEPALKTRVIGGACIFANRPGWPTGAGCALHQWATETGESVVYAKPEVCWQLPLHRDEKWVTRPDGTEILVTTISEYRRRDWGNGGHDFGWYCSSSPSCHTPAPWSTGRAVWRTHRDELIAMVGEECYDVIAHHCEQLEERSRALSLTPILAVHPATAEGTAS